MTDFSDMQSAKKFLNEHKQETEFLKFFKNSNVFIDEGFEIQKHRF